MKMGKKLCEICGKPIWDYPEDDLCDCKSTTDEMRNEERRKYLKELGFAYGCENP